LGFSFFLFMMHLISSWALLEVIDS
jgi:hypothetical protein